MSEKVICGRKTSKGTPCKLKRPCRFHMTELIEALPKIPEITGPEDPNNPYHVWLWKEHKRSWTQELDRVCELVFSDKPQEKLDTSRPWTTLMDATLDDEQDNQSYFD